MNKTDVKIDALMRYLVAEDEDERNVARKKLVQLLGGSVYRNNAADAEQIIAEILLELGSPDHLMGYPYVIQAIKLVIESRKYINNITFGLYPQLAAQFDTTAARVERAIRHLIEVTWNRGDLEVLEPLFRQYGQHGQRKAHQRRVYRPAGECGEGADEVRRLGYYEKV